MGVLSVFYWPRGICGEGGASQGVSAYSGGPIALRVMGCLAACVDGRPGVRNSPGWRGRTGLFNRCGNESVNEDEVGRGWGGGGRVSVITRRLFSSTSSVFVKRRKKLFEFLSSRM